MQRQYDAKHKPHGFRVGDRVLKYIGHRLKGNRSKLLSQWSGPFEIIAKRSPAVYTINKVNAPRRRDENVNAVNLIAFRDRKLAVAQRVRVSELMPFERRDKFFADSDLSDFGADQSDAKTKDIAVADINIDETDDERSDKGNSSNNDDGQREADEEKSAVLRTSTNSNNKNL